MADASLSLERVQVAIDEACGASTKKLEKGLTLQRATSENLPLILKTLQADSLVEPYHRDANPTSKWNSKACRMDVPNFFGLMLTKGQECMGLITFYFAYSTWDGRVLYLDKLLLPSTSVAGVPSNLELKWSIQYTLIDVTLRTGCARLTWQVSDFSGFFCSF